MAGTDVLQVLLVLDILGMAILAIFYLRQRPLSWLAFLGWGLLAVLVPILGPFLAITSRPGSRHTRSPLPRFRIVRLR